MKAMVIKEYGVGPDGFTLADVADPVAGPGEVLVKVAAASVNPLDYKLRANGGVFAPDHGILGCDAAGEVVAVGPGVTEFAVGDIVYGCIGGVAGSGGTYAELIAADVRLLAKAPTALPLSDVAAIPLVAITAWEAMDRLGVKEGTHILIHGGAGGVGHVAVQMAKLRGARVATTVSSEEKAAIARGFGADEIINYREEGVADYVARLTGGKGFDAVLDTTGGKDLVTSLEAVRLNGQVGVIVASFTADLSLMHAKALTLHAVFMPVPLLHNIGREAHGVILREVAKLVDAGKLRPLIDAERFPLERVGEAHAKLEAGKANGKLVIEIAA